MNKPENHLPAIEPAIEKSHLSEIAALADIIWREHYASIITQEQIEYMLRKMYDLEVLEHQLLHEQISFDCLRRKNRLIGFTSYGPTEVPREMKLHKLYLLPAEQRKGYGSLLLKHIEGVAVKRDFTCLILAVNKRNYGAIRAYERNGFRVREEIILDIGGGFVMDDYVMEKNLLTNA
jgi:ribosomal protein S18 acetylase RimI-like enzyme